MNSKKSVSQALLVSVAAVILFVLCFAASKGDALVLGLNREAQKDLFPDFFAELRAGDYDAAMEYVSNYESLGFEKDSTELVELYKTNLLKSYSVSVVDHDAGEHSGLSGSQVIDLTFLDSRRLLAAINEKTAVAVKDYLFYGNKLESDEQALSFVYTALSECLQTPEAYHNTERLTVQTCYEDGEWKIVIDDVLMNALQGYINDAAAGIEDAVSGSDALVSASDAAPAEGAADNE